MSDYIDMFGDVGTGGLDDSAASDSDIRARIDDYIRQAANLYDDINDVPQGATIRPNGTFQSPQDLYDYLDNGGLLHRDKDGNVVPNPIVHVYWSHDLLYDSGEYEVYIDVDTS